MQCKTQPRKHQLASMEFAKKSNGRVAFFHSIGSGKSYCSILSAQIWGCKKILVVSPTSVIQTWKDEVKKHTNWKFIELMGDTRTRQRLLLKKGNVYNINWEGLKFLFGRKVGNQFVINDQAIFNLDFDCVIFDECHRASNPQSLQTKIAHLLSMSASHAILLTGTPISGSELDLWGQFWVLDNGKSLDRNFFVFRNQHFKPTRHITPRHTWVDWKLGKGEREKILDKISPITLRFDRKDCCDLPPITYEKRLVDLSKEQLDAIDILKGEIRDEFNPKLKNKLTKAGINKAIKLAQIPGGAILTGDGSLHRFKSNPKLSELIDLLEQLEEKVIIFHAFVEEGRMIEKVCKKKLWKFASLRGEIKDKPENLRRFLHDKDTRILIAHPLSGGEGLNLQIASIVIFYSNGFLGSRVRKQAEGRIYREGQTNPCLIIDLIAKNSLDENILKSQLNKRNVLQSVLDYIAI